MLLGAAVYHEGKDATLEGRSRAQEKAQGGDFRRKPPPTARLKADANPRQLGDCHSWRCLKEWYPHANNITLSKYAFELPEIFDHTYVKDRFPAWEMGIFGHSPDTANEWDFYPGKWADKTSDATMFGYDGSCKSMFRLPRILYTDF